MAAYWLSRCKVNDPVEYKKYTDLVPGIIAKYGGKVLARGGKYQIMEGTDICFAPVLTMSEATKHPHMAAREVFIEHEGKTQPAPAPRFSRTPSAARPPVQAELAGVVQAWGG